MSKENLRNSILIYHFSFYFDYFESLHNGSLEELTGGS